MSAGTWLQRLAVAALIELAAANGIHSSHEIDAPQNGRRRLGMARAASKQRIGWLQLAE